MKNWPTWSPTTELDQHLCRLIVLNPDLGFKIQDLETMDEGAKVHLLENVNERLGITMDVESLLVPKDIKQVIVVRADLKMRKGKEAAQVAHASMMFLVERIKQPVITFSTAELEWINGIFTKVVLSVDSEQALLEVYKAAMEAGLVCHLVTDVGKTEFHGIPTHTCLAIGPDKPERIDPITRDLKLR